MKATLNRLKLSAIRPFEPVEITILLETEADVISLYHRFNLGPSSIIGAYSEGWDGGGRFPNLDKVADADSAGKFQVWQTLQKIIKTQKIKL